MRARRPSVSRPTQAIKPSRRRSLARGTHGETGGDASWLRTSWLQWFRFREQVPTEIQQRALEVLSASPAHDVMLVAPTGTGKTAAAMVPLLLHHTQRETTSEPTVGIVVVVPVRALAVQQRESIAAIAHDITLSGATSRVLRVGLRTGDTAASVRERIVDEPPDVLVTTPESLAVMLAGSSLRVLAGVHTVVLDEVHQLAQGKRGALLSNTLEMLNHVVQRHDHKRPLRVALSATVHPLQRVADWVGGVHKVEVVRAAAAVVLPETSWISAAPDSAYPSAGWTTRKLLPSVARAVATCEGTTLLFVNSRGRAELWARALRDVLPARMGVACFHGSLSAETREEVLGQLRRGELRVVVCTNSLESGVDFEHAEQVMVLGSPASVTQLVQSSGRSGHRPGERSRVVFAPLHATDILFGLAAKKCMHHGLMEPLQPHVLDMDVALQSLVGWCLHEPVTLETLQTLMCRSDAFRSLSRKQLEELLEFLSLGGDAVLGAYPEAQRVLPTEHGYVVASAMSRRRYVRNVGTIVDEPLVQVTTNERVVGLLDGRFAATLNVGQVFALAGETWRVLSISGATIDVKVERSQTVTLSRWQGQRVQRSDVLARACSDVMLELGRCVDDDEDQVVVRRVAERLDIPLDCAFVLVDLVRAQRAESVWPNARELLVECVRESRRVHCVLYTFAGSAVNEAIGHLLAGRIRRATGHGVETSTSDFGVCVTWSRASVRVDEKVLRAWLDPREMEREIVSVLHDSAFAHAAFREVVRVAQVGVGNEHARVAAPGQASPSLLYDVLRKFAPSHVLLRALEQNVLRTLECDRAQETLRTLLAMPWDVRSLRGASALAVPLFAHVESSSFAPNGQDLESALVGAAHALYARHRGEMP